MTLGPASLSPRPPRGCAVYRRTEELCQRLGPAAAGDPRRQRRRNAPRVSARDAGRLPVRRDHGVTGMKKGPFFLLLSLTRASATPRDPSRPPRPQSKG